MYDDEAWGDLGDAYAALGDSTAADACWAVARLRDTYDDEWLDHDPDPRLIADFLLARDITTDDAFVGEMARTADYEGFSSASRMLFDLAWALDPADPEWSDMNKGREIPAAYVSAIAAARAEQERLVREEALQTSIASILMDPQTAYNWGNAGSEARILGDSARGRLFLSMAHFIEPMGGYDGQIGGDVLDPERAGEAVRAVGITDDETVGRLANDIDTRGQAEAARSLFALALEMDPDDPEWRMKVEEPERAGFPTWVVPIVNLVLAAGLALLGARMGRDRRRKLGLAEKPRKTKGLGWRMEFPPVKEKLAAGWQLGDQPADAVNT
jgi:tetratricopeptide (TPR) repeat protein